MGCSYRTFEEKILELESYSSQFETVSLNEIGAILGHSSHYVFIMLLAVPFLQPIPLPAISTPVGALIAYCSIRIMTNKRSQMPGCLKRRTVAGGTIQRICHGLLRWFRTIASWTRPRYRFMGRHTLIRRLNGSLMLICGLLLMLPLPIPLTNTLPAWTLAILCLGSLREDGLLIAIGWSLFVLSVFYVTAVVLFPLYWLHT